MCEYRIIESGRERMTGNPERSCQAVLLNCRRQSDNALVEGWRSLQPGIAVIMFSSYCGVPCSGLALADACLEKRDPSLLTTLRAVLRSRRYGLCRSIAA